MIKALVIHKYANRLGKIVYAMMWYKTEKEFDLSKSPHPTEQTAYAIGYHIADILLSDKRKMNKMLEDLEEKFNL